ncbi:hypothetical protein BGZ75_007348 [Mortierella antarctica]|nr:hypothetical protein BGZ75_007348 [Mortierella antarctica]
MCMASPANPRRRVVRRHPIRLLHRAPAPTTYYEEEYEVQEIVAHRWLPDGTIQFLVNWVGYPTSANTWQTEDDLANAPDRIREYKEARGLAQLE